MRIQDHEAAAARIEASLRKCEPDDHEMLIEGAMLAGSHRLNARLHRSGATREDADVMHTYLLTVNEFRRLSVADAAGMSALSGIEDLRPAYVRGCHPGGREAAQRALSMLAALREEAPPGNDGPLPSFATPARGGPGDGPTLGALFNLTETR
jgi:hypothetical protein